MLLLLFVFPIDCLSLYFRSCIVTCQGTEGDDIRAEIEDSNGHRVHDVTLMTQNGVKQIHFKPSQGGMFRVKAFLRGEEVNGRSSELASQSLSSWFPSTA